MDKKSNFIGAYFRQYLFQTRFDRKLLAKLLNFNYSNNDRMICAYLGKKDYLWKQFEVENWCSALKIKEDTPIYSKLIAKCGRKNYDYGE